MNNTKHTPGPWCVDGVYIIRGPKRCVVAKLIDSKEPYETKVANGHMLAAAPAMYEALKGLLALQLDCDGIAVQLTEYHCHQVRAAQAALAQADGKQ